MAETQNTQQKNPTPAKRAAAAGATTENTRAERSEEAGILGVQEDGVVSSAGVEGEDLKAHTEAVREAGSFNAQDHHIGDRSFDNPALRGSGTIAPDGTGYLPPLPDPQIQRGAEGVDLK